MERRAADYSLLAALKAFEPASVDLLNGTSGNIQWAYNGNRFGKEKVEGIFKGKAFYEVISAPMLLSRLCAGFHGLQIQVGGQENYKTTWDVALKHKESGNIITFYDWKGGPSFGSNIAEPGGIFKDDVAVLLLALVNDRFPHPYDGCCVGEIA